MTRRNVLFKRAIAEHQECCRLRKSAQLGLLFRDAKAPSVVVLYTQTVSDETLLKRMTTHWQVLDARRLGESGVPGLRVAVVGLGEGISVHYPRPDGEGVRYALQLSTGEIVCLN